MIDHVPTSGGSYNQLGGDWSSVVSADGDASYVYSIDGGFQRETFYMSNLPSDASAITSCTLYAYERSANSSGYLFTYIYNGASNVFVGEYDLTTSSYAYTSTAHYYSTIAGINGAQTGVGHDNSGNFAYRCTHFLRRTWYVSAPTSMVSIWSLIPAVLGTGITLASMSDISQHLQQQHKHWFVPQEYAQALDEWNAYRHPKYYILGDR